jgi:beta-lactamase class A
MLDAPALALLMAASPVAPSTIEQQIAERLQSFRGVMGVAAAHLVTGEAVGVNADMRFPTASAIKTAVMVEAFHQIAGGRLSKDQEVVLTDEIKVGGSGVLRDLSAGGRYRLADLLYLMIALSDNTATNMVIALVGTQAVNERMDAYGLPMTRLYRPTFRDGRPDVLPDQEKEFGLGSSTPRETARLMERIARGQAVSREASEKMTSILARQHDRDMIPRRLPDGEGVTVANKTGQDDEKRPDASGRRGAIRNDSAIVTTPKGRYVVAIFTRRVQDTRDGPDNEALVAGAEVSRLLFEHFTKP